MSRDHGLPSARTLIEKSGMLRGAKKILCAVSGGSDSMCLLHFIGGYAASLGISVCAAHYNHKLRGAESDRDETFVRTWCEDHGIEFVCGSGDVGAYASESRLSVEEAARDMRYAFLEKAADELGADRIATAHNADDLLETIIMNLCRGSGTRGLAGIPPVRGRLIRPLLGVSREEITAYLENNGIPHIEDSTNALDDATRNAVRHSVIPALKAIYPYAADSAYRCAGLSRSDDEYLTEIALSELSLCAEEDHGFVFSTEHLLALPAPVSSRMFSEAAKSLGSGLNTLHVDKIFALASSSSPSAELSLPGGLTAKRRYGELVIYAGPRAERSFEPFFLTEGEWVTSDIAGYSFLLLGDADEAKINGEFNIFCFKKSSVCGKMLVRPRKTGDSIRTSPRGVTKTLKKLFIEKKIPADERERIFVIADDEGVLMVNGIGTDLRAKCDAGDEAVRVAIKKIN